MNEIQLYNNKQIIGGFLLIIMLAILFASNILLNSGSGLNISYFVAPVVLTISILCIYYVIALNKSIKNTYDRYIRPTEYDYKKCPNNYTTQSTPNEIKCEYDADNSDIEQYDLIGSGHCNEDVSGIEIIKPIGIDKVRKDDLNENCYENTETASIDKCQTKCSATPNCNAISFVSNSSKHHCCLYEDPNNLCSTTTGFKPPQSDWDEYWRGFQTYKKKVPNDKRTFFLEGRDAECGNQGSRSINGCFNHYDTTNTQCKEIFDYFDRNKYILDNDNWPEFKNMCILDPNPKVD
jgi:hypothetical protein